MDQKTYTHIRYFKNGQLDRRRTIQDALKVAIERRIDGFVVKLR